MFQRCFGAVGTRKRFVWFVWAINSVRASRKAATVSAARTAPAPRAHEPPARQLGATLLCIFAGLTASALEKLVAEIRKGNSDDTTQTRMYSLLQANCVASIIFVMMHFMTSLVRYAARCKALAGHCADTNVLDSLSYQAFLMGRWFSSAPPGMLFGIVCTQTASNMCLLLAMASPLVAYDITMVRMLACGLPARFPG
jgi:hypothetical protein